MKIVDLYHRKKPVISFEVFPPKREANVATIYQTVQKLVELKPDYISVTYGAGGSGSADHLTADIASFIKNECGIEALPHLTCAGESRASIQEKLNILKERGIDNVLALRGDVLEKAQQEAPKDYQYAIDLIKEVKRGGDFSIGAAAYPEGHIEADSLEQDLNHLAAKVEAGADYLISQLFFENRIFYHFYEKMRARGIETKISAGIMPILNKKQIEKMIYTCGASLPAQVIKLLAKYEHQPDLLREKGIEYAAMQVEELLENGVDGVHLYTMNQPEIAKKILNYIGLQKLSPINGQKGSRRQST